MRNGIAAKSNVFKLFDSESGMALDGALNVELPNFELKAEAFSGAGVGGEVNVPAPGVMSPVTVTISYPIIYGDITRYMELGSTRTLDLRNEIVVKNPDMHTLERVSNRWVLKGPLSGANPGSIEQGAAGEASVVMQVYYAHHWLDGTDVLEWDPFKYIYTVNGNDMMAATRQNILG